MRARNIKPGFFDDEVLAGLGPYAQLLFEGLWCLADRDGKLEDRPARIKAHIFPYYDPKPNVITLLYKLCQCNFIQRYSIDGSKYIKVIKFKEHQNPHPHEAASKIPDPIEEKNTNDSDVMACNDNDITLHGLSCECNADSLIPDSLIPDSLIRDKDTRARVTPSPKILFGTFVKLTQKEYDRLLKEWGKEKLDDAISRVDQSINSGKKYIDHNLTLRNWDNRGFFNAGGNTGSTGPPVSKYARAGEEWLRMREESRERAQAEGGGIIDITG